MYTDATFCGSTGCCGAEATAFCYWTRSRRFQTRRRRPHSKRKRNAKALIYFNSCGYTKLHINEPRVASNNPQAPQLYTASLIARALCWEVKITLWLNVFRRELTLLLSVICETIVITFTFPQIFEALRARTSLTGPQVSGRHKDSPQQVLKLRV